MNKKRKIIGILGGAGPVATADIFNNVIKKFQKESGAVMDADFPELVVYNLPLEDFSEKGFDSDKSAKVALRRLIGGVRSLESAGADMIIITCNTTHFFLDELQSAVRIPILNLIDETARRAGDRGFEKVAVLSSRNTRDFNLYGSSLELLGLSLEKIPDSVQKKLDGIILNVMAGKIGVRDKKQLLEIENSFKKRGVDLIVIGCTELSVVQGMIKSPVRVVDSARVAVDIISNNFRQ